MGLLSTLKDFLKKDSLEYITTPLKGYLKKDIDSIYSFLDKDSSIKLVFNNKFIKDYLSTFPNYLTYDSLDNYAITLKRYSFDFLIYTNSSQISFKIICYVDTFAIDTSLKKLFDPFPDNVNMISEITIKAKESLGHIIKQFLHSDKFSHSHNKVTANNFIYNNFSNELKHHNVFSLIKKEKGFNGDMFLIKTQVSIDNKGYLFDDNDSKVNFQLNQIDWKGLYVNNSRVSVPGKEFNPDGTPLVTLLEKVNLKDIHVSDLNMDVDIGDNAVKEFLKRKKRRMDIDEFKNK